MVDKEMNIEIKRKSRFLGRAREELIDGRYSKAIEKFLMALACDADIPGEPTTKIRLDLAQAYEKQKAHGNAIEQLRKALELGDYGEKSEILARIGIMHHRSHNYPEALENLSAAEEMAAKTGVESEDIYVYTAATLAKMKKTGEALNYYARLSGIDEEKRRMKDWEIDNNRGFAHLESGDYPEAIVCFKSALKSPFCDSPGNVLNNIGDAYLRLDQTAKAVASFEEASKSISPETKGYAKRRLGDILYDKGDHACAFQEYSESERLYTAAKHAGIASSETADKVLRYLASRTALLGFGKVLHCFRTNSTCQREISPAGSNSVFVCMPFGRSNRDKAYFSELYTEGICLAAEDAGFEEALRADKINSNTDIVCDICSAIQQSQIVIADISYEGNPNVMYEVGLAHAFGKEVVLLMEEGSQPPFDLSTNRHVRFRDKHDLRERLAAHLVGLRTSGTQGD